MTIFSERHGLSVPDAEIRIREEAPDGLRDVLPTICYKIGYKPGELRALLCELFLKAPDPTNWTDYPNIAGEVRDLLRDCAWFEVYDAIEAIYAQCHQHYYHMEPATAAFEELVNRYFRREGIGWQLTGGRIEVRGTEAFEAAVRQGRDLLWSSGKQTAATELHEAISDLSRRPSAEITGSIQHAMAALECVARDKLGGSKETLGDLIRRNPNLFPKPIDEIVSKAWGYSSNFGRHLQEGAPPTFEEAELLVGISGVMCRYLVRKA